MRRSEFETIEVSSWGDRLAGRIARGEVDAEFVIRTLEPYASDRRRERLQGVFASRMGAVTLVLDGLHDPHNGAALVRTSEALGLARIHVVAEHASFLAHAKVAKGTHKWLEVRAHREPSRCVQELRETGHVLVGAHPDGTLLPADLAKLPRVAIVLGNEHQGISKEILDACEQRVRVPMRGFAESLNVSVSGAILLAFATEGRPGDLPEGERRRLYARGLAVSVPHADALLEAASRA
jgi:tRNA (guanosine-2'-O-)-methyltransferase